MRTALAAIGAALTNDGRFAFETRNPLAREWEQWDEQYSDQVADDDRPDAVDDRYPRSAYGDARSGKRLDEDRSRRHRRGSGRARGTASRSRDPLAPRCDAQRYLRLGESARDTAARPQLPDVLHPDPAAVWVTRPEPTTTKTPPPASSARCRQTASAGSRNQVCGSRRSRATPVSFA